MKYMALVLALCLLPFQVKAVERETIDFAFSKMAAYYNVPEEMAAKIISCESAWNPDAVSHTLDFGLWQISQKYHEKTAAKMGYNIHRWQQNLEYGFLLFKEQGVAPWSASRHCWGKTVEERG